VNKEEINPAIDPEPPTRTGKFSLFESLLLALMTCSRITTKVVIRDSLGFLTNLSTSA